MFLTMGKIMHMLDLKTTPCIVVKKGFLSLATKTVNFWDFKHEINTSIPTFSGCFRYIILLYTKWYQIEHESITLCLQTERSKNQTKTEGKRTTPHKTDFFFYIQSKTEQTNAAINHYRSERH